MIRRSIPLTPVTFLLLVSCSGMIASVGNPWDPREENFFDDGVDMLETPDTAAGQWGLQQKNLLEGRIQLSDFVAIVDVQSIKTSTDVEKTEIRHIDVEIHRVLYGNRPESKLSLKSAPSSPGYVLIKRHERHLTGRFILFSRWFEVADNTTKESTIEYHFHLTPASPAITAEVKSRLSLRIQMEAKRRVN
jgi:hypothetical protein